MDQNWIESFRKKLDDHYTWPALYIFKFIVPTGKEDEVKQLFPDHNPVEKASKQGNYKSVTVEIMMSSGDAVLSIYLKASRIEGIVAL
jgi:putative lipoic acid-binding regulatory protein